MEVLVINGHDYSRYVERKGYGWSRNDIDDEKTTRTRDFRMRRGKVGRKRKLSYKVTGMTREQLAQLDDDLSAKTFQAAYLDLHGVQTREFYSTSFSATVAEIQDENDMWEGASFNMIEA